MESDHGGSQAPDDSAAESFDFIKTVEGVKFPELC